MSRRADKSGSGTASPASTASPAGEASAWVLETRTWAQQQSKRLAALCVVLAGLLAASLLANVVQAGCRVLWSHPGPAGDTPCTAESSVA